MEPFFLSALVALAIRLRELTPTARVAGKLRFFAGGLCAIFAAASFMESEKWADGIRLRLDALLLNPENISLKSSFLTEIVNRKPAEGSKLHALRTRLIRELEESCARFADLAKGARSPALNCRFFYMDAFRLSIWQGNFALAEAYLRRLEALGYGNIVPEQQLHRFRFELAIASGTATAETAADWLAKRYVAAEPLYRKLELFARCLAGEESVARKKLERWTRASLLKTEPLSEGDSDLEIHPRYRENWRGCLGLH